MAWNSRPLVDAYLKFLKDSFFTLEDVDKRRFWRYLGKLDPQLGDALRQEESENFQAAAFDGK